MDNQQFQADSEQNQTETSNVIPFSPLHGALVAQADALAEAVAQAAGSAEQAEVPTTPEATPPLADLVATAEAMGLDVAVDNESATPGSEEQLAEAKATQENGEDPAKTLQDLPPQMVEFLLSNNVDVTEERAKENERLFALRKTEVDLIDKLKNTLSDLQFEAIPMSLQFFQLLMGFKFVLAHLLKAGQLRGSVGEVIVTEFAKINDYANSYIGATVAKCVTNGGTWMNEEEYMNGPAKSVNTILEIKAAIYNALNEDGDRISNAVQRASANAQAKMAQAQALACVSADEGSKPH